MHRGTCIILGGPREYMQGFGRYVHKIGSILLQQGGSMIPGKGGGSIYIYIVWCSARRVLARSWVRISLEANYLQHLSAQLIHYIPPYLSTV